MHIEEQEGLIDDFAVRCFRDTGDQDYIHARLAYRAGLHQQFLWSSLQVLEKYLKAILLFARIPSKNLGHDLSEALKLLDKLPFKLELHDRTIEFIEFIDMFGGDRYQVGSSFVYGPKLYELDSTAWDVRRYCQKMLDEFDIIRASQAVKYPYHQYNVYGGLLERILQNRKHPARSALVWQNAFYTEKSRKIVRQPVHMHATNSPLSLAPELIAIIEQYVHIPRAYRAAYRNQTGVKTEP
jgi:HEPN domain-containing protein